MRASQIAARAVLVCSAAGIACALWSAIDATAAHATGRNAGPLPTVELAGGLVATPSNTVKQIPHQVTKLARATTAPALPVKQAQDPIERVLSTVIDAVQAPTASTATTPAAEPELPDTMATPHPAGNPTPEPPDAVPAVVLLAGTTPSTIDPTQADSIAPAAAALPCGTGLHDADPPRAGRTAAPDETPCVPDGLAATDGLAAMKPPTKTGADQIAATAPSDPAILALRLLGELLPRSDLPTGRTEHPEPGPA